VKYSELCIELPTVRIVKSERRQGTPGMIVNRCPALPPLEGVLLWGNGGPGGCLGPGGVSTRRGSNAFAGRASSPPLFAWGPSPTAGRHGFPRRPVGCLAPSSSPARGHLPLFKAADPTWFESRFGALSAVTPALLSC